MCISLSLTHTQKHTYTLFAATQSTLTIGGIELDADDGRRWEKKGELLYWYRNMRDPVTLSEEVYE